MPKLVILDRDGVINQDSDDYVKSEEEWHPISGSIRAIAMLSQAGIKVAIATNQSGLARGYFEEADLSAMHSKLERLLKEEGGTIDMIRWCPHGPDDACDCRKPSPGMIQDILRETDTKAKHSVVVGDSLRDLEAAVAADCQPILVKTGKGLRTLAKLPGSDLQDVPVYPDLMTYVRQLLQS